MHQKIAELKASLQQVQKNKGGGKGMKKSMKKGGKYRRFPMGGKAKSKGKGGRGKRKGGW